MTAKQYVLDITGTEDDNEKISKLEKMYNAFFPNIINNIISKSTEPKFFDDGSRMLSFDEMLDAENDLNVKFCELGIFPIMDCCENDFIVYNIKDKSWSKFNIVDEIAFDSKNSLEEML